MDIQKPRKFKEFLQQSFTKYISGLLLLVALVALVLIVFSFYMSIYKDAKLTAKSLETDFLSEYHQYQEDIESLDEKLILSLTKSDNNRSIVASSLYQISNKEPFKSFFILVDKNKNVVISNYTKNNEELFASSSFLTVSMNRLNNSNSTIMNIVGGPGLSLEQSSNFSICKKYGDLYLFINLRNSSFDEYAYRYDKRILITDPYDNIVYTSLDLQADPEDKYPSNKTGFATRKSGLVKEGGDYYYSYTYANEGFYFYAIAPVQNHLRVLAYASLVFMCMASILIVAVRYMTDAFVKSNTQEVNELVLAVDELRKGNFDYHVSENSSQEFVELYENFRDLVKHNNDLLQHRREMEVKQVEEQFNPHFVFNVMETVRYQINEDPKKAQEMLLSFANLMRYSINSPDNKVLLETDIEYLNDYLLLQKVRYNQLLEVEFNIPEELLDCLVPRLFLQPLIENSLKHGFIAGKVLHLEINAKLEEDALIFEVKDDGKGMSKQQLLDLENDLNKSSDEKGSEHIGLYTIHKMLSLLYGQEYGLKIESKQNEGTSVYAYLPYEVEDI